jgi:hypothetical protein
MESFDEQSQLTVYFVQGVWDHGSEVGFIKKIEDNFQRLAELIIKGLVYDFDREQTHAISSFYVLWTVREETRNQPEQDGVLQGILSGCRWSTHEEEELEKVGFAFQRGNTVPARVVNGLRIRVQVGRYLRQINPTAHWGIVQASDGEFVVPNWPVHAFVPINPALALANPARNQRLDRDAVQLVNEQLRAASRRYFFARDFAACP